MGRPWLAIVLKLSTPLFTVTGPVKSLYVATVSILVPCFTRPVNPLMYPPPLNV